MPVRRNTLVLFVAATAACFAQTRLPSVQASTSAGNMRVQRLADGSWKIDNAPLKMLVGIAYNVKPYEIAGGPAWIDSDKWDVHATQPQMQNLLRERFGLAVHRETREVPVYNLTVAQGSLKLKPSACRAGCGGIEVRRGRIEASGTPMQPFADALSEVLGRPVIDKTGLGGTFDIRLEFLPDDAVDATGPDASIFNVLEEQLGLKLEPSQAPAEMLIIDRAEKPSKL
jgi:uncharacterized protein (TIGR03435 family)